MDRISVLKEKMLAQPRFASIEQAKIITKAYRQNEGAPTILKRAIALKNALAEMEIAVEPEELIVGNRTKGVRYGVVSPEGGASWIAEEFADLPNRPQDKFLVHPQDIAVYREEIAPYWAGKSLEDVVKARYGDEISAISKVCKINQTDHAQGHICPNSALWLREGPGGILAKARQRAAQTEDRDKQDFYNAVAITMEGAQIFMGRYAALLFENAAKEADPATEAEAAHLAAICRDLQTKPADSFQSALQSVWFLFVILQMESNASSFSPGRMDQWLLPYYQRDKKAGKLTEERAQELICCFFLKCNEIVYLRSASSAKFFAGFPIGFNIALGGQDSQGEDAANELSFLFLNAQERLGLPQPNLSLRLHPNTPRALLQKSVEVVSKGSGMPQYFNDSAVIPALTELGITEQDARNYAIVGCVELTTQGNNLGWSDAAMFNLNKALELALNHGVCLLTGNRLGPDFGGLDTFQSFEEAEHAFFQTITHFIPRMIRACEVVEQAHMDVLPSPFLSAVVDDCLEKGLDVTCGGAHYNLSGIQMIQIANLADSLAALKLLVFEEKQVEKTHLLRALRENFANDAPLRTRLLNRTPNYGNDIPWVDELGAKWAAAFRREIDRYQNIRGGKYHTGMYTVSAHVPMGENVGATPDGRFAQEPLADGGMSPVYGRDVRGPTAVLKSVSRLPSRLASNGGLLNMKFLPEFFQTEEGIAKFCLLLRTLVDLKIPHIQFNVLRREDLLAAQKDPEHYRNLTVRVAGYTAYFTELADQLQNEIIARTAYGDI